MSQSLAKIYVHIVFSTKYRQHLISNDIEADLHAFLGGIANQMECNPIKVGGFTDHIHILCMLSKKVALMDLMEELKRESSKWVKQKISGYNEFYWQRGYGAFSIREREIATVTKYIANQKNHHTKVSFQDEYRSILKHHHVDYDERYIWD